MAKRPDSEVAAASEAAVPDTAQNPFPTDVGGQELLWNTKYQPHKLTPQEIYPDPCCWIESPARCTLLKKACDLLTEVATMRGTPMIAVTQIRACVAKGEKAVYIVPAPAKDSEAIPVRVLPSTSRANLISVMEPAELLVPKGFKDRYLAAIVGTRQGSPVGWALKIDLNRYEDRQEVKIRTRKKSGPA